MIPCDEQGLRKHHESRHVADKKFKCEECPKSYATRAMLKVTRRLSYTSVVQPEPGPECIMVPAPVPGPDLDPNPT